MGAQQLHEKSRRNSSSGGLGLDHTELEQCQTSKIKRAADANVTTEKKAGANEGNSLHLRSIDCKNTNATTVTTQAQGRWPLKRRGVQIVLHRRCRKVQMQPRCDHVSLWPDTLKRHAQRQHLQIGQYPATKSPRCSECKSLNT